MLKVNKYYLFISMFVLLFVCIFSVSANNDTIIRANFSLPFLIDPAVGVNFSSSRAINNLYDGLVYPTPEGTVEPYLAESWEVSDNGKVYTFKLKKGVKFHNGSELTAEDVKFSFDRFLTIGEGFAYNLINNVNKVTVIDDYTVEFELNKPMGPFLLTLIRFYVLNKEQVMDNLADGPYGEYGDYGKDWLSRNDAGTGAYQLVEYSAGDYLMMQKYDEYFSDIADNAPEYFKMLGTLDAVFVKTSMKRRELEISDQWQSQDTFTSLKNIEGVGLAEWPDGGQLYIMFNTKLPPLDDIHVRKALSYVFDYDVVTKQIFPNMQQACGPVARTITGWKETFQYQKDLGKAEEELKQSKYYGELDKYPIEFAANTAVPDQEKMGLMFMVDAKKIGLDIEITKVPYTKLIDRSSSVESSPHVMLMFINPHYPEAGSILKLKYHSSHAGTIDQIEWLLNDEIDNMIDEAISTLDKEKRLKLYGEIQDKIVDLAPNIFTFDNLEKHAYQEEYINWPQISNPIPATGFNFDMRFIEIFPDKKKEIEEK